MHRSGRTYLLQLILLLNCRTIRFIPTLLLRRLALTSSSLSLASFFLSFVYDSVCFLFHPSFLPFSFSQSLITAFTLTHSLSLSVYFLPSFFLPFHLSEIPSVHPLLFSLLYSPLFILHVFLLLLVILFTSF